MRLFVAAELPSEMRLRLGSLQDALRSAELPVRWVRPEGIHLTLKFLGETRDSLLEPIMEGLSEASRGSGPFRLTAGGAAAFPDRGAPRLIWVEVRGDLARARWLAEAIDERMVRLGFPPESREYRPHLTLGRVKGRGHGDWRSELARVADRAAGEFPVTECVLFQSRLGPGGAVYTQLRRFPLAGSPSEGETR